MSFQIANSTGGSAYLHRLGEDYAFGYGYYDTGGRNASHGYDMALAVGCDIIRQLSDGKVEPIEILAIRREAGDVRPYLALGRCPVRFDQSQCCIILSGHGMACKLKQANRAAHQALLETLQQRLARPQPAMANRVRHVLRPLLLIGKSSLEDVAAHLGMHPRALGRRLEQEATGFAAIKDDVRFSVARELLALTALSSADIAASLDYSTPSAFVHAFQRWAGTAPTQWRRAKRG